MRRNRGMASVTRVGARRIEDVPDEVLRGIESGTLSTATHIEHMAVDQSVLWRAVLPNLPVPSFDGVGFISRLRRGGAALYAAYADTSYVPRQTEPDTVLAWRAFAIAAAPLSMSQALDAVRPFAEHAHFAVREWAWLALRNRVANEPALALRTLTRGTCDSSSLWRRFASEVTRPRSVWGIHIADLKADPEPAAPLLRTVWRDPSPYVQTSVTNWLNDVVRLHRVWVEDMCRSYDGQNAAWFVRRALRSAQPR